MDTDNEPHHEYGEGIVEEEPFVCTPNTPRTHARQQRHATTPLYESASKSLLSPPRKRPFEDMSMPIREELTRLQEKLHGR